MRLLIDHDILLYRALWGCKEGYYKQLQTCDHMIEKIIDRLESDDITLIMTGPDNFRYALSPSYKANRKEKPFYLYDAKRYYEKYWGAVVSVGCEADDVIGMAHGEDSIVVSSDKDMYQLGGLIYNPVKDEMYDIENPWYFFYLQMLTGDKADNVQGVKNPEKAHFKDPPNFTEATAKDLLKEKTPMECKAQVVYMYYCQYGNDWPSKFETNAKLLFLKRADAQEYYEAF